MPQPPPAIHVNDGTVNESMFIDNVPYNSTVCSYDETTFGSAGAPNITTDMENTVVLSGLIDKLVAARDAAVMQDSTLGQNYAVPSGRALPSRSVLGMRQPAQPSSAASSKIPRQATGRQLASKNARKLRRSNSCSEIVLTNRRQGETRRRIGSSAEERENMPSIRYVFNNLLKQNTALQFSNILNTNELILVSLLLEEEDQRW